MILNQFAIGGVADWLPTYIHRTEGLSLSDAGLMMVFFVLLKWIKEFVLTFFLWKKGATVACAGFVGTLLGAKLADMAVGKTRKPYFLISGLGMLLATFGSIILLLIFKYFHIFFFFTNLNQFFFP